MAVCDVGNFNDAVSFADGSFKKSGRLLGKCGIFGGDGVVQSVSKDIIALGFVLGAGLLFDDLGGLFDGVDGAAGQRLFNKGQLKPCWLKFLKIGAV